MSLADKLFTKKLRMIPLETAVVLAGFPSRQSLYYFLCKYKNQLPIAEHRNGRRGQRMFTAEEVDIIRRVNIAPGRRLHAGRPRSVDSTSRVPSWMSDWEKVFATEEGVSPSQG